MEIETLENCQTCLRPPVNPDTPPKTQWVSFCRCFRPYAPNSQFSIDVCGNCKKRVSGLGTRVECAGLCSCENPDPKKVPTYIKPEESDPVSFDPASIGLSPDSFPIERYAPIAFLGDSARVSTILCRDKQRGTKVAVKCFKRIPETMQSAFDSELRKIKQLTHTNIAKIVDHGFHNNKSPYLVTEYKDGFNLEQCLALHGIPSPDIAVKILLGILETSIYAQKQGMLHGDVRAANVIFLDDMNSQPSVAITDFALPKIKASEELTEPYDALYMSSEEARNMDYSEKAESYSIGCVGFALLTGRPPFLEGTARDIKNSHALKLPPRISNLKFDPKRPGDLDDVVHKCLEKDPKERFDSLEKFQERLEVFPRREQMQINAVLASRRRAQLIKIAVGTLVVIAVCAAGYFTYGQQ